MSLLSPLEFYRNTLAAQQLTLPAPSDPEKVAQARGVSVPEAKLAEAFFQQMQLDNVEFPTAKEMADAAFKFAAKYRAHVEEQRKQAAAVADGAMLAMLKTAASIIQQHKIAGVTAADLLRVAAHQLDSMDVSNGHAAWAEKTAEATQAALCQSDAEKTASASAALNSWLSRPITADTADALIGNGAIALSESL